MKNSTILIAVFTLAIAASGAAAEGGAMGALAGAGSKISSIDMNKNFGQAGSLLDGFYTGAAAKANSAPTAVYLEPGTRTLAQAEKEVCNAKPAKISRLTAAVPALKAEDNKASAGKAPATIDPAALLGRTKSWSDDLETVVDYVTEGVKEGVEEYAGRFETRPGAAGGAVRG